MTTPIPAPDDRLARAEAAFREAPAPEGPSADLAARTRAALRAAEAKVTELTSETKPPSYRRSLMFATFKFGSAAALALGAVGLAYLAATPRASAVTAFEEAAKKIRDARTLSYRSTVRDPGSGEDLAIREYHKDPGLTRAEIGEPAKATTVMDMARGKILTLDHVTKTALLQDVAFTAEQKRGLQRRASETVDHLRGLAGKEGKPAGRRKIGEVDAEGFRVDSDGYNWTVWVDAARNFPLLVETNFKMQGREKPVVMGDFQIDAPLDDALFRLDPPEGYTSHKLDAPIPVGEEALIVLFRLYAKAGAGDFPPKLDDLTALNGRFPKEKWKGLDDPQMIRTVQAVAASVAFVQFGLKDAYGYAPEGAKLGDAKHMLFWYRPKGSNSYRAVFADLHAEDVAADRLPEKPKF